MCCLAFKYHSRTARPTAGDTVARHSDHLWQRTGFQDSCHHIWHSSVCRQTWETNETVVYCHVGFITLFAQTIASELCSQPFTSCTTTRTIKSQSHFKNWFLLYALVNFQWTFVIYNYYIDILCIGLLTISNDTNCLNLFHPIRILDSTAASTSPSTLNMSPK